MKRLLIILFLIQSSLFLFCQEIPVSTEQQLENLADADQAETEDDTITRPGAFQKESR